MNLSDPRDVKYLYDKHFGPLDPELPGPEQLHRKLEELRYNGAMTDGDIRTSLICVTNILLDLLNYMRKKDGQRPERDT